MKLRNKYFLYNIFILTLSVFYFNRNLGYAVDDSFITYRYAHHLKEGFGLVFNVGEKYYGTTAAGYAVILAGLSSLGSVLINSLWATQGLFFDIPTASTLLAAVAIGSIAITLPTIAKPGNNLSIWMLCYFGALFLFLSAPFNEVAGHETYVYLATAFIGIFFMTYHGAYVLGALLLALAASFRPDAILFGGIAPLFDWLRSGVSLRQYSKRPQTISFILLYIGLLTFWFAFLAWHFGSFLPGTMAAKKAQVALGYWSRYNITTTSQYLLNTFGRIGFLTISAGLVIWGTSLVIRLTNQSSLHKADAIAATWFAFGLTSAIAYFIFNVTFWPWYGVPLAFSLLIPSFFGLTKLLYSMENTPRLIKEFGKGKCRVIALFLFTCLALPTMSNPARIYEWAISKNINPHISAYSEIVDFIHKDAPDGAVIQMAEPGSFGYHLGPKYFIVDELGLISPGVATALATKNFSWPLEKWHADYIICSFRGIYSACEHNFFENDFELVGEFNYSFWKQHGGHGAQLYKRVR